MHAFRRKTLLVTCLLSASGAGALLGEEPCGWTQWGQGPAHESAEPCSAAQAPVRTLAVLTIDRFAEREAAETGGNLLVHYQVPLSDGAGWVYTLTKGGRFVPCHAAVDPAAPCGIAAWSRMVWMEKGLRWKDGALVQQWSFTSDWKPEPIASGWEPMFQPAIAGDALYVPGAGGTVFKLDRTTGKVRARIDPFGGVAHPNAYVAGGLAADRQHNVYFNVLELKAASPWSNDAHGWLVKVSAGGTVRKISYSGLIPGAPNAGDLCYLTFASARPPIPLPWPPPNRHGRRILPPQARCLTQRPAVNVTPAIGEDGTIFTVSRAHGAAAYAYLVALRADLSVKWTASLRGRLQDGCGVLVPFGAGCRQGATPGVDPATNLPPAGSASDIASSSPVALPDGGVVFGAVTSYNGSRGHLFKFDRDGNFAGSYDFGWDITPAVYRHDGTYSLVLKDNHYFGTLDPDEEGPFSISQLDPDLHAEWRFDATNTRTCHRRSDGTLKCVDDGQHRHGFEWCVNAPAVDSAGTVHVTSEDGFYYAIAQGGVERARTFLALPVGAAYTPMSLDFLGRVYALNDGTLRVLGEAP